MPPQETRKRAASKTPSSNPFEKEDWKSMTVAALRDSCNEKGLDTRGAKAVLIQRLTEYHDGEDAAAPKKLKKNENKTSKKKSEKNDAKNAAPAFKNCTSSADEQAEEDRGYPSTWQVYADYRCMLNQIRRGNDMFYELILMKTDSSYNVITHWGRVGEKGQTETGFGFTLEGAVKLFKKKFRAQTKNSWDERNSFVPQPGKYTLVELDANETKTKVVDSKVVGPCSLDPHTMRLIEMIFDDSTLNGAMQQLDIDLQKMPLGKLSKTQIAKGFDALLAIEDAINTKKSEATVEELSNTFYTQIPNLLHLGRRPVINTSEWVRTQKDMLLMLSDIELTLELKKEKSVPAGAKLHPLDEKYERLHCRLTPLSTSSKEYKVISNYIANSSSESVAHRRLWKVDRESEGERFEVHDAVENRKLLWHGASPAVVAAILNSGLRIMPHSGGRCGKGLYFDSEFLRSPRFAWPHAPDGTAVMFLSEVALGNEYSITQAKPYFTKPPNGYDSVVARGRTEPDSKCDTTMNLDGKTIIVPQGKPVTTEYLDSDLLKNEYVIYDESRVRIRYLLTFR